MNSILIWIYCFHLYHILFLLFIAPFLGGGLLILKNSCVKYDTFGFHSAEFFPIS